MELIKDIWTKADMTEFQLYLMTFSKGEEKGKWEQRIVNTSLPCIAVPSDRVREIVRDISKGNFISFIDMWQWDNFTNTTIIGGLICRIKDIKLKEKYLTIYSQKADNWATIDTIKIKPKKDEVPEYMQYAKKCVKSTHTFTRRLGVIVMLKLVGEDTIADILSTIITMRDEKEYYVNMALAWLLAECFTKCRVQTLTFIESEHDSLNKFVINKAISKCRDSYRISASDKDMLIKYRVK